MLEAADAAADAGAAAAGAVDADAMSTGEFDEAFALDAALAAEAGAYTRPLFSSTSAVSVTMKHPTHPEQPLYTPLTRATQPPPAPPIPHKVLKLS